LELAITHEDTWESVRSRLPSGWEPDFVVLYLPYTSIPLGFWSAPVPLIGLAADWNLLWHHYRRQLRKCDLVLTDAAGVEAMKREGISHAREAILYGCGREWCEAEKGRDGETAGGQSGRADTGGAESEVADTLAVLGSSLSGQRDIDILFVGNLHPAVQRERLPWLGRLARLSERWKVEIHTGVFGEAYRELLGRARIVFNRGIRGEANRRVFEVAAAGALLFQEEENLEVPSFFRDRQECVYYNEDSLEPLLEYHLEHEEERRTIAEAARGFIREYTFESFWKKQLALIEQEWPSLCNAARQRSGAAAASTSFPAHHSLMARTWEALSSSDSTDPTLARDLAGALVEHPHDGGLHNALGLVVALTERGQGPITVEVARKAAGYFQRALDNEPDNVMAGLNLAESLVGTEQKQAAVEQVKRTLAGLARGSRTDGRGSNYDCIGEAMNWLDAPHFPPGFDLFRVEWERAAWANAGDSRGEVGAKQQLLRWRLHLLLADLTGELSHFYEAVLARPDLSPTQGALGCALGREVRVAESTEHLRNAVNENPFDLEAARALAQVLKAAGDEQGLRLLARERRLLAQTAPKAVPAEDWFVKSAPVGDELTSIIILCCDELEYTRKCLDTVFRHTRSPYELILVDNGSTDGTREYLEEIRLATRRQPLRVEVIRNEKNLGYAAGCNQGIAKSRGRYVVFLNNDTIVTKRWLEGLIAWSLHEWPTVGMVGAVTNYAAAPQQIAVDYADLTGMEVFAARRRRDFAAKAVKTPRLTGCCLLIRREVLDHIGWFDDRYGIGFFEDDDLCVRVREAGYQLLVALNVFVHHFGSRTFQRLGIDCQKQLMANFERFKAKWGPERAAGYRLPGAVASGQSPTLSEEPVMPQQTGVASQNGLATRNGEGATVSLCMIVKNEEGNLPGCLESAARLFDEIIVVDTGSTDKTKEVAAQFGAKVIDFPWPDSFAVARNESLHHATGAWVFWLDADDRLDEENRRKLTELFARLKRNGDEATQERNGDAAPLPPDIATSSPSSNHLSLLRTQAVMAYSMKCLCLPDPRSNTSTVVDHVRLFRRHPEIRWEYRVHEQVLPSIRRLGGEVQAAPVVIKHVGYLDPATCARKHERDLRLLLMDHAEQPDDPFTLFNLGWAYSELKKPKEALPMLRRSLELSQPRDSIVRKLFALLVQCHRQMNQPVDAIKACLAGRQFYPEEPELLFQEALARRDQGDRAGAEACLLRVLESQENGQFASVDAGLRSYKTRHNLAVIHQEQGRAAEAEAQWRAALAVEPTYVPSLLGLGELYLAQGRFTEVETIIEKLQDFGSIWAPALLARKHLAQREFLVARQTLEDAISRTPQEPFLWVVLSHALLQEGKDWDAAEQVLHKILELDPDNMEARNNLNALLGRQGRMDDENLRERKDRLEPLGCTP
jgi:GT2 family glycosyltransferase/Tfp pilus assembly protein PilF